MHTLTLETQSPFRARSLPARRATGDPERDLFEREMGRQYQVVRLLGRGGMGAVYLVRDLALHRHVAVKVLRRDLTMHDEARERFRREARMGAQLEHPSIVPIHDFGDSPRLMYIVMRYICGESLGDRLRRERCLPAADVRRILVGLAGALDYAHGQGVVHRDLKPENVLLERETGAVVLADFGVATRRSWDPIRSELRRAFGTPHFMSPEQAMGEVDLDGRSDLYGVGVLGFLMLAGRLPFDGGSVAEITAKHLSHAPPSVRSAAPGTPRDLASAIDRCLAKEPTRRWRNARELIDSLSDHRPWWAWWRGGDSGARASGSR